MTEPLRPLPDGYLDVYYVAPHGEQERWWFKDIRGWDFKLPGLLIVTDNDRTFIPWHRIKHVKQVHNSPTFLELISRWSREAHPSHTEEEPDGDCELCRESMIANRPPTIFGMEI